jgi:hypothetical protein
MDIAQGFTFLAMELVLLSSEKEMERRKYGVH